MDNFDYQMNEKGTYQEYINEILKTRGRNGITSEKEMRKCDWHHIIPRCMNGTDEEDNLIHLYYREHFVAHFKLMIENPNNPSLIHACWGLCNNRKKQKRYKFSEQEREVCRARISELMSKKEISEITKKKISQALKNRNKINKMSYKEYIEYIIKTRNEDKTSLEEEINCGDYHHIIPTCMGGSDEEENLIYLTPREHFVAHYKLMMENPDSLKLITACWALCNGEKVQKRYCVTNAEREVCRKLVSKANTGKIIPQEVRKKIIETSRNKAVNGKKIVCLETELIYKSIKQASRLLNIPSSSISRACSCEAENAGGYHWVFLKDKDEFELKYGKKLEISDLGYEKKRIPIKVYCVELEKIFNSVLEAANFIGVAENTIRNVCRGRKITAKGYHWVYLDKAERFEKENNRPINVGDIRKPNSSCSVYCVELDKTFRSIKEASLKTGISIRKISSICKTKEAISDEYHWAYEEDAKKFKKENKRKITIDDFILKENMVKKRRKKVYCVEIDKIFDSISNAATQLKLHTSSIRKSCNCKEKTSGGYHWMYLEDAENFKKTHGRKITIDDFSKKEKKGVMVYCVELKKTFNRIKDAESELNISLSQISEVRKGKRETCGGYHWEFIEDKA